MSKLRALLMIGGLLLLSSGRLSAQAMKVTCKDGSKSAGGQGACSSHGGVAKAGVKADTKIAKTQAKADAKIAKTALKADAKIEKMAEKAEDREAKGATALCKDKTYSHAKSPQGMCSGDSGVSKILTSK